MCRGCQRNDTVVLSGFPLAAQAAGKYRTLLFPVNAENRGVFHFDDLKFCFRVFHFYYVCRSY
jgi:hypothetical protein